jgi:hypothetical protein
MCQGLILAQERYHNYSNLVEKKREKYQDVSNHSVQNTNHRNTDHIVLSERKGFRCVDSVSRNLAA